MTVERRLLLEEKERLPGPLLLERFGDLRKEAEDREAHGDLRALAFYTYWQYCLDLFPEATALLVQEEDLWPFIYTPNIGPVMRFDDSLEKHLPENRAPLTISIDDTFIERMEKNEGQAIDDVAEMMKKAIKANYEAVKSPGASEWNDEMLKKITVCVCDGGRPLGEGDLGRNARGITRGKLDCIVAVTEGNINPAYTLGILLDVGTDRKRLLKSRTYLGQKKERMGCDDSRYRQAMETVKMAFKKLEIGFVQDEDFEGSEAWFNIDLARKLELLRYFDDDVHGTGNLMNEIFLIAQAGGINIKNSAAVCHGAGGAGTGIKDQFRLIFGREFNDQESDSLFWFLDSAGLLVEDREKKRSEGKSEEFTHFQETLNCIIREGDSRFNQVQTIRTRKENPIGANEKIPLSETLKMAVEQVKREENGAIFLYGFSMTPSEFDDEVIKILAEADVPVFVVAGSNPPQKCEIMNEHDLRLLNEAGSKEEKTAVIRGAVERFYSKFFEYGGDPENLRMALGSNYIEMDEEGRIIAQGNNLFTFGAIVRSVIEAGFDKLTDKMLAECAQAGARFMLEDEEEKERLKQGALYPRRSRLKDIIRKKTAAMIWAGLVDDRVRVDNPRWQEIRKEVIRTSEQQDVKAGRNLVEQQLDIIDRENRERLIESILVRQAEVTEEQVVEKAYERALSVLNDPELQKVVIEQEHWE